MLARTWPGLILVLLLDIALMPVFVLIVGLSAWAEDMWMVVKHFQAVRAVRGEK